MTCDVERGRGHRFRRQWIKDGEEAFLPVIWKTRRSLTEQPASQVVKHSPTAAQHRLPTGLATQLVGGPEARRDVGPACLVETCARRGKLKLPRNLVILKRVKSVSRSA